MSRQLAWENLWQGWMQLRLGGGEEEINGERETSNIHLVWPGLARLRVSWPRGSSILHKMILSYWNLSRDRPTSLTALSMFFSLIYLICVYVHRQKGEYSKYFRHEIWISILSQTSTLTIRRPTLTNWLHCLFVQGIEEIYFIQFVCKYPYHITSRKWSCASYLIILQF